MCVGEIEENIQPGLGERKNSRRLFRTECFKNSERGIKIILAEGGENLADGVGT